MAKRKKAQGAEAPPTARVRKHIKALGLYSPEHYAAWCRDHGFPPSFDKGLQALREETRAHENDLEKVRSQTRIHRNPKKLIEQACAGEVDPEQITRPQWRDFCRAIASSNSDTQSRESLCRLLITLYDKADFAMESASFGRHRYLYADALVRLNDRRGQWIRPLEDWIVASHNADRQFSSLLRHLLAHYTVPRFMDAAWCRSDTGSYRLRDWFIHIGMGKNIRTAKTPVPLTKRMAHHFADAPDDYSIENAIRWGQIHALGGDRRLTEAILGTPVGEGFDNDDFWLSVIRFFIANPMLDRKHVGPIVDFLNHRKFETHEVITGPGQTEFQEPSQPNLTMRGRTPESLLGQMEEWHHELGRIKGAEGHYFKRSGVKEFNKSVGADKKSAWRIRELLSTSDLAAEGKAMRHCVVTYADSCARGHCSIWAMELHTPSGIEKHQTVEVTEHGMVVQSRGKFNRPPTTGEFDILKQWAREAGLSVSNYIDFD